MAEEHIQGGVEKISGRIKEAAGALTGNSKLKNEGRVDQLKGGAHQVIGDIKDALNPNRHPNVEDERI
jgi:uncharacterized protein YjbJ (UPF0337 family)